MSSLSDFIYRSNVYILTLFYTEISVELGFEQNVYRVSEDVGSEDLALYACLTADNVDRPFTATITPVSGTATGIDC